VTEATNSIGAHTTISLVKKGYYVFAGVTSLSEGHRLKTFLSASKQHLLIPVLLDVTQTAVVEKAIQTITHYLVNLEAEEDRNLIAIINTTSSSYTAPLESVPAQDWMRSKPHSLTYV
jgi:hypothetical protein